MARLLLMVSCLLAFNNLQAQQFRLFATNLYDFGPAMSASPHGTYFLQGSVANVASNTILISVIIPNEFTELPRPAAVDPAFFDPGEMLKLAYVRQRMQAGSITAGELMSWDEDSRLLYALELKYRRPKTKTIELRDYPKPVVSGQAIEAFALPISSDLSLWNYGKPCSAMDATNYPTFFKVYPASIVKMERRTPQTNSSAITQTNGLVR